MTPVEAFERIIHCLDRGMQSGFRVKAFVGALESIREMSDDDLRRLATARRLEDVAGIGASSAKVIEQALAGDVPEYLQRLEVETVITVSAAAHPYRQALRGDCHVHTSWSDGGATIEAMASAATGLGHEYMVLTDHSPRLTIAHGLDRERLLRQLEHVAHVNETLAPFRVLTGMEVDILLDGTLDLGDDLLARLDVVVASVHSKLKMPEPEMTERMVRAVESPHVDILGHCTGRLIDKRPASMFDAERVFAACVASHTAVEINCRPERLDPPRDLLSLAVDLECWFAIDSDAHATGQLEWQPFGCERAAQCVVPVDRIINTMTAQSLVEWAGFGR